MKKANLIIILALIMFVLGYGLHQYIDNSKVETTLNQQESLRKSLFSIWHDAPAMAAAAGERYTLCPDGTFTHYTSQYDLESRLISQEGTWNIVHNNLLQLTIIKKTVLVGGQFEKYELGEDNEYILRNARKKQIVLDTAEIVLYPITELMDSTEREGYLMVKIGGMQFYSMHKKKVD